LTCTSGPIAKLVHLAELPGGIDVQEREWRLRRVKRLQRQMEHHRTILADRVEHDRLLGLRDRIAHDVDALGLEALQMGKPSVPL
jgi:hypothetical protein